MDGERTRGAFATLGLSSVVLVVVLIAGSLSMAPLGEHVPRVPPGSDRSSVRVLDNVTLDPSGERPSNNGEGTPGGEPDDGDVAAIDPDVDLVIDPTPPVMPYQPPTVLPRDTTAPDGEPGLPPLDPTLGPQPPPGEPVGPVIPRDPTDPVDPVDPTDPVEPVDPVDPVDPGGPSD
ncbi:MAG TPA: hypothetical protein VM307_03420, partial [Egibacteraceae bacterium]|nr:hypothetical protein [Egibacteraceae bacterium]